MEPISLAVLGCGRRTWTVYFEFLSKLADHFKVVAVCDPRKEAADEAAEKMNAKAFYSLSDLVKARPMEAAVAVTPIPSHYPISVYLSRHGIHHIVETSMASTLGQCRAMVEEAKANKVLLHVNEQFFRREVVALARKVIATGAIGDIHRIFYYHGHTGYHNNSIFQVLCGGPPETVRSIAHTMPVHKHLDGAGRWHDTEKYQLRMMHFKNGMLAIDNAGNIKSAMGRYPRPGYLEIVGTKGTFVEQSCGNPAPWEGQAEVRLVAEEDYERGAYAESYTVEWITMVTHRVNTSRRLPHNGNLQKLRVKLPGGTIEHENPFWDIGIKDCYQSTVAQSMLDFAGVLREGRPHEFSPEAAVASQEMETAFALSQEQDCAPIKVPPQEESQSERNALDAARKELGVDPMDVEAVIEKTFPKNYAVPYGS